MTSKAKLIRTVYLYLAALVSLIFVAVGVGRVLNTGLKYYIFPEAEKKSFYECNQQPPYFSSPDVKGMTAVATEDQKMQLNQFLQDYQNWKENSQGDSCIVPARQNSLVDAITMILIALPICLVHWRVIKKEKEEKEA
jgi:hypothetical protein